HLEREYEMEARIKSASVYPVIVAIVALAVVFFILSFVMPSFVSMFQAAEVDLPGSTRALLAASLFLRRRYWLILILALILYLLVRQIGRMPTGRYYYDYLKLHLPVVGPSISRIIAARFTRTMGTLVRSGIPILQALEVSQGVVNNAVVSRAIAQTRHSIREGDSIAAPLEAAGVFDPMVSQMIAVGEEAGSLDDMLIRMSDFYEREVMYSVDAMMSVIEPLLILLLALLVGGIVVATLMPVLELMNTVGM
ncbi:MAG TPA: type II secretion system F family protein, partial [Syntrophomonadaceae bacterium]|nr:type II secretion system F family protein [Syntrophomonadaceae bacterium]